jgi:Ca2+/Na+ antiporter
MNETSYNLAMLGKDYIDKAIEGLKELAPKAYWYLQWKCRLDVVEGFIPLLMAIILGIVAYKITVGYIKQEKLKNENFKFDPAFEANHLIMLLIGVFSCLAVIICIIVFITTLTDTISAFTPICPIDKAIEIGAGVLK